MRISLRTWLNLTLDLGCQVRFATVTEERADPSMITGNVSQDHAWDSPPCATSADDSPQARGYLRQRDTRE